MKSQYDLGRPDTVCNKAIAIAELQKDILFLQGFKQPNHTNTSIGFRPIELSFPHSIFPTGCIHEFLSDSSEDTSATAGFVSGLLSHLIKTEGVCAWLSKSQTIFPPALKIFGIEPHQLIFINLKKERDLLWTMEEALKCDKLTALVCEVKEINFKESRRLQLATEQSRVTGFLLRQQPRILNTIACVSRWRITSLPSQLEYGLPGVGFPRWNVELLKVRNGKPGNWKIEWSENRFRNIDENIFSIVQEQKRKTG